MIRERVKVLIRVYILAEYQRYISQKSCGETNCERSGIVCTPHPLARAVSAMSSEGV